jgi:uncharacterized tellurite resistance protein B-like protein
MLNHIESAERKKNKEYFSQLIEIALADGKIDPSEHDMLHRMGSSLGLSEPEIDEMIRKAQISSFIPPYELSERFTQLYHIVKMILADGVIANSEMRMATVFALKSGFTENEIPSLMGLLIAGVRNQEDEEELWAKYKKKRVS